MSIEKPSAGQEYTWEQRAALENERTLSDAELIKGGARWKLDKKTGEKVNLELTEQQIMEIGMEHGGGIADNLGTYIRMNKRIALPFDSPEVNEYPRLKKLLSESRGAIWQPYPNSPEYYFIDRDSNVAAFKLSERDGDYKKIKSISQRTRTGTMEIPDSYRAIEIELKSMGFTLHDSYSPAVSGIGSALFERRKALEAEQANTKGKGFNF